MNNNYIDLMGIEEKYPNLKYDDKKNILTGTINICKKCNDMVMFLKKGEREEIFGLQFIVAFIII